jgi:hypothetical protein
LTCRPTLKYSEAGLGNYREEHRSLSDPIGPARR